jgi:hypothetical protein
MMEWAPDRSWEVGMPRRTERISWHWMPQGQGSIGHASFATCTLLTWWTVTST